MIISSAGVYLLYVVLPSLLEMTMHFRYFLGVLVLLTEVFA